MLSAPYLFFPVYIDVYFCCHSLLLLEPKKHLQNVNFLKQITNKQVHPPAKDTPTFGLPSLQGDQLICHYSLQLSGPKQDGGVYQESDQITLPSPKSATDSRIIPPGGCTVLIFVKLEMTKFCYLAYQKLMKKDTQDGASCTA